MRARGVQFMPTPATYFDALSARLQTLGVGTIDEDIEVLRRQQILVDGEAAPACSDVPIEANALVYSGEHRVDVVTAREVEEA